MITGLIIYCVFAYLITYGIILNTDIDDYGGWFIFIAVLFSPISLPIYIGKSISELKNK